MKIYFSNSVVSIIVKVFILIIFSFFSFYSINYKSFSYFLIGLFICFSMLSTLKNSLGFMVFTEKGLFVSSDIGFFKNKIQKKLFIKYRNISSIEFCEEECTSDGEIIRWRYTGVPPYLKIILHNGDNKRIYLGKYSLKSWIKFEKKLKFKNIDIVLKSSAKNLIDYRKTGIRIK